MMMKTELHLCDLPHKTPKSQSSREEEYYLKELETLYKMPD